MKKILLVLLSVFSIVNSYGQTNLTSGLIVYYPFSGNASNAIISTPQLNGQVNGALLTKDALGVSNQAYLFNGNTGSGNDITCNLGNYIIPANNQFSVSIWVKPATLRTGNGLTASGWIVNKSDNSYNGEWGLKYFDANPDPTVYKLRFGGFLKLNPTTTISFGENSTTIPLVNSIYHLCLTVNGNSGEIKLFINGNLEEQKSVAPFSLNNSNIAPLEIGTDGIRGFDGVIDEFRYYQRELTSTDITALFNLNNVTGLDEAENLINNKPFPNPAGESFTISHGFKPGQSGVLRIYDLNGQIIKEFKVDSKSNNLVLEIRILRNGTYLYQIESEGNLSQPQKFIVQH